MFCMICYVKNETTLSFLQEERFNIDKCLDPSRGFNPSQNMENTGTITNILCTHRKIKIQNMFIIGSSYTYHNQTKYKYQCFKSAKLIKFKFRFLEKRKSS